MRIAAFAAALVAVFGLAVLAGRTVGPEPDEAAQATEHDEAAAHAEPDAASTPAEHGAHGAASPAVRGLATGDDGLRLVVATPELERGRTQSLRFRVLDARDRPVRSFELGHERRMHAIVVRRDLTGFQHLHPRMAADGTWSVPLRLDAPGSYRLYADFRRAGAARTLSTDLRVDGDADLLPLPAPVATATSDGGDTVRLDAGRPRAGHEATLRFAVERDGQPVALDPYLGADGHLVALREGDLAFLHVHPIAGGQHAHDGAATPAHDGRIAFATTLPSAGRYRLFLQYRVGAQVRTAAFTLEVAP
jgi:hypothetical protein